MIAFFLLFSLGMISPVWGDQCCVRTIGFWKNHPEVWEDHHDTSISCCYHDLSGCGSRTWFDILQYKRTTVDSDGEWRWIKLARQFVAAQLGDIVLSSGGCDDVLNETSVDQTRDVLQICEVSPINETLTTRLQEEWDAFNNAQVEGTSKECAIPPECPVPPRECIEFNVTYCSNHVCHHGCEAWTLFVGFINRTECQCFGFGECDRARVCCDDTNELLYFQEPQTIVLHHSHSIRITDECPSVRVISSSSTGNFLIFGKTEVFMAALFLMVAVI
jgi:hypothetical protein